MASCRHLTSYTPTVYEFCIQLVLLLIKLVNPVRNHFLLKLVTVGDTASNTQKEVDGSNNDDQTMK